MVVIDLYKGYKYCSMRATWQTGLQTSEMHPDLRVAKQSIRGLLLQTSGCLEEKGVATPATNRASQPQLITLAI